MSKMRAIQVTEPKAPLEIVEREIPEPGPGSVRIKVQACGICHSDSLTKDGSFPLVAYPRIPGHEVVGVVDSVAPGVSRWTSGQRVGVGWHGGNCGYCDACRRGDFFACQTFTAITGVTYDGGYAEYMIARAEALAAVPDDLSAVEAAPLMCPALRRSTAFATPERGRASWWPCSASAVWAISAFSSLPRLDTGLWRLRAVKTRSPWLGNSARGTTSIASRRTQPRSCAGWAARKWSWRRSQMAMRWRPSWGGSARMEHSWSLGPRRPSRYLPVFSLEDAWR